MPWIIGIDEAGYGPNLGPFVMTAAAARIPDGASSDLWELLAAAVRRHGEADDGRLLVADSKLVHGPGRDLGGLERGVRALQGPFPTSAIISLDSYGQYACPDSMAALGQETWYAGMTSLPLEASTADLAEQEQRLAEARGRAGMASFRARSVVVCPARFNELVENAGTKGAVLQDGLARLLRWSLELPGDDPVAIHVDKHGGRNFYAAMLQDALPDGSVWALEEGPLRSAYRVRGLERELLVAFEPRADAHHFCVSLASMASKYLRELLMREFNAWWRQQVPGLEPTAGYPGDARRFFRQIEPAIKRLGLSRRLVWREK